MPKLTIDGMEIEVAPGTSVLQAAEQLGIEIPRFCYHDKLSVPANCRMCLVQVEKMPKPVASCALPCSDGQVVTTNNEAVQRGRKGVMEMMLINHPLDCPICDQGGECDLQDQAMAYGFDRSRFQENKRSVEDKDFGPLIKTVMTRCIHCTRCVRFANEIAGVPEIGALGRGEHMEITNAIAGMVHSELSGNIIDVCPVGALTSKPFAFTARPWEMRKTESVDVMDAVGSNIRVDVRGREVMRILPRLHEGINEEWLDDKARFAYDGLKNQRLDRPYMRVAGKLKPASWDEAFAAIAKAFKGRDAKRVAALAGDLADCESMQALKRLMQNIGSQNLDCRVDGAQFDVRQRSGYLFNASIAGIEQADVIVLVGCNPRLEAPLVNARIRKTWRANRAPHGLAVYNNGAAADLTYPAQQMGNSASILQQLADGRHELCATLKAAKNPMIIMGQGAFRRRDGLAVHAAIRQLATACNVVRDDWNGLCMLHNAAARVGGLDLGFVPGVGGMDYTAIMQAAHNGALDVLYLLGVDTPDVQTVGKDCFVIYQGHHGDAGAHRADVILPGAAYTEKNAIYVNTEGRAQYGRMAASPPGEAREDWAIIRALSDVLKGGLDYVSLADVRRDLAATHFVFQQIDHIVPAKWNGDFGVAGPIDPTDFVPAIDNYYMTNPICRASQTMAKCVAEQANSLHKQAA